jgi:mannose-6-phosphate isomerase-like protein (cupin superfamily)
MDAISIDALIDSLPGPWQPRDVAVANDAVLRVARLEGEFEWHAHDEDELFICWDGRFRIEFAAEESVDLGPGDVLVVPAGVEHRPVAEARAHALLLERPETLQYGNR